MLKKEYLIKWQVLFLKYIIMILWCIVFIYIYNINRHGHGNNVYFSIWQKLSASLDVCCNAVTTFQVLFYLFYSLIGPTPKCVQQYTSVSIDWYHVLQCNASVHLKKINIFIVSYIFKNIDKENNTHTKGFLMETYIETFTEKFYILDIQNMAFNSPRVRILGKNHCGKELFQAFHHK